MKQNKSLMPPLLPQLLVVKWRLIHNSNQSKQIKKSQVPRLVLRLPFSIAAEMHLPLHRPQPLLLPLRPPLPQRGTGNIRGTFRQNIWGTFREQSGNVQGIFAERSGNIRGILVGKGAWIIWGGSVEFGIFDVYHCTSATWVPLRDNWGE
jgi:hypothetical protein